MTTIAELAEEGFHTHRRPDGREHTHREVWLAMNGQVEPSHLSKLRNGRITHPGGDTLLLCRFFNVPPSYFFSALDLPPAAEATPQLTEALHSVLRSTTRSPHVREKLETLTQAPQA